MKIERLQVNHMHEPVGYDFSYEHFSWDIEEAAGEELSCVQVEVFQKGTCIYDSKKVKPDASFGHTAKLSLKAGTRYEWRVYARSDQGEEALSEMSFFETGKMGEYWSADWLLSDPAVPSVWFTKELAITEEPVAARLYICGLGLYEVYIDGQKAGEEYLMPGYHSYDFMQEYQTLDVTDLLTKGSHTLGVLLGNGWYKGRFVFEGGFENIYGDRNKLIAELVLTYADGRSEVIPTDASWKATTSAIGENSIYDGEVLDFSLKGKKVSFTTDAGNKDLLMARTSMPIHSTEEVYPAQIIHTPAGETVLDFGEMITGWVRFCCREKEGSKVVLQYGELLQEGNFYRDNLRTAKAAFTFVSEGKEEWVRPHFTYYGFRYVKVEGIKEVRKEDFVACRLMSETYPAGSVRTGNEKVNRLLANARTSQKCNFLSVPTDCPQRDERMGWTGDIAIFADTACLNQECSGFFSHYLEMLGREQKVLGGSVPLFVPKPKVEGAGESMAFMLQMAGAPMCVWGDAGVILPWTIYEHGRDEALLRAQYPIMKSWVDCVGARVAQNPIPHLWQNDLQLGDWLALDNDDPASSFGKTDSGYLATACYVHILDLTAKAARVLEKKADEEALTKEKEAVICAFQENFLNSDGTLLIAETQTAYALLLAFSLCRKGQETVAVSRLQELVAAKNDHLDTGFLGTAYLCPALSANGAHDLACRIFLQEDYPGWLHEVNLGAVSIWERWNSLDDNGKVSSTGMNSMNHYAYGSISAWVYRYLCGFKSCLTQPYTMEISPLPCRELGSIQGSTKTPWGRYELSWEYIDQKTVRYTIRVPFGARARLILPGRGEEMLRAGVYIREV